MINKENSIVHANEIEYVKIIHNIFILLKNIHIKAEHFLCGTSVHITKLALMALYPFGRSDLAREIKGVRATVKLIAYVSFSDTRRKMVIDVLAGRYFISRDAFTIVWKRVCSLVIIVFATSSRP